jgi:hypothetical protein
MLSDRLLARVVPSVSPIVGRALDGYQPLSDFLLASA